MLAIQLYDKIVLDAMWLLAFIILMTLHSCSMKNTLASVTGLCKIGVFCFQRFVLKGTKSWLR